MTKEMSKRQQRREKMRREQQQRRLITIGLVTLGAVFLAAIFILPTLRTALAPVGDIATVEPREYPEADGLALGDPNAPVKIDVFEDFQCPACRTYTQDIEPQIIATYVETGQAYYVFHHYPFIDTNSVTKESQQAANAAMCANEQDKFWEYHEVLFANWNGENQGAFTDRRLLAFAGTVEGLDQDAFTTCFEENRYEQEIDSDFELGQQMGVNGTPSVFVNGEIISPGFIPQFEDIQAAVEAIIATPQ
ncbi:MAG: thioredoxin domain-containing protein [Chloroflexota bacterium]